ncbi:MAG: hypothetical protein V1747_03790 [Candidatus Omnitrophota bacterium]
MKLKYLFKIVSFIIIQSLLLLDASVIDTHRSLPFDQTSTLAPRSTIEINFPALKTMYDQLEDNRSNAQNLLTGPGERLALPGRGERTLLSGPAERLLLPAPEIEQKFQELFADLETAMEEQKLLQKLLELVNSILDNAGTIKPENIRFEQFQDDQTLMRLSGEKLLLSEEILKNPEMIKVPNFLRFLMKLLAEGFNPTINGGNIPISAAALGQGKSGLDWRNKLLQESLTKAGFPYGKSEVKIDDFPDLFGRDIVNEDLRGQPIKLFDADFFRNRFDIPKVPFASQNIGKQNRRGIFSRYIAPYISSALKAAAVILVLIAIGWGETQYDFRPYKDIYTTVTEPGVKGTVYSPNDRRQRTTNRDYLNRLYLPGDLAVRFNPAGLEFQEGGSVAVDPTVFPIGDPIIVLLKGGKMVKFFPRDIGAKVKGPQINFSANLSKKEKLRNQQIAALANRLEGAVVLASNGDLYHLSWNTIKDQTFNMTSNRIEPVIDTDTDPIISNRMEPIIVSKNYDGVWVVILPIPFLWGLAEAVRRREEDGSLLDLGNIFNRFSIKNTDGTNNRPSARELEAMLSQVIRDAFPRSLLNPLINTGEFEIIRSSNVNPAELAIMSAI